MPDLTLQQAFELALAHHQAGRLAEAESIYRQILAVEPNHPDSWHNLAVLCHQLGHHGVAIDFLGRALALRPAWPEALCNLSAIFEACGQFDEAIAACQRAIGLAPDFANAYLNLGNALRGKGLLDEAIAVCQQAMALRPDSAEAYNSLGVALRDRGQVAEAILAYKQAQALNPKNAEVYNNLGNILKEQGRSDEAVEAYHQAIALNPHDPKFYNNLSVALRDKCQLRDAIAAIQQALKLKPKYPEAYLNLGNILKDTGQLEEAIQAYRQALAQDSKQSIIFSNFLFTLHYLPAADDALIAAELERWNQQIATPLRELIQAHANDRSPERRLRIGYFSPDLRDHPVGQFLLPLLEHHDRDRFEIFAYAQVINPDELTEKLRERTDMWRSTVGLTDARVAEMIREDKIDILVDLAMHTANNRLPVFARKPAPVQVAYLAYVGSTGLSTMDYRLSDPSLDPPGMDESIYCERTIRLPGTYWCYRPAKFATLPVGERQQDTLRFGCLSNFCKINGPLLDQWSKILAAVPDSRLLLHAYEGDHRQALLDRFAQQGIAAERIEIVGIMSREEYFKKYQSLDITLDTTPYGGGTTTCDSLWMGVPVVTLAGERAVGRGGVSILTNVGLPELIARTPEEYIQIAVELANDKARLQELRATLRERMQASPLMQEQPYARSIEAAYRQMWRTWCEQLAAKPSN